MKTESAGMDYSKVPQPGVTRIGFRRAALAPIACGLLSLALAGCAQYAVVTRKRPALPVPSEPGERTAVAASANSRVLRAMADETFAPQRALGEFLAIARAAQRVLVRDPANQNSLATYNFAVARVIATIDRAGLDPWDNPISIPSPTGAFLLSYRPRAISQGTKNWNPALYRFTPTDELRVRGTYFPVHERKPGLGAPLVAVAQQDNPEADRDFLPKRTVYGVTALILFQENRAQIVLEDPLATESTKLEGHTFPLAGDYTLALATMLAEANPKKLELSRLLNPGKYAQTARLVRLQPFDPNKRVVLVIHGLMDSPATWAPMVNHLRSDPEIRNRYQFWFFSYPSGYPYPYSALLLRNELDAAERRFPIRKPMILVGHSMGGCISRLLVTDPGDKLWLQLFRKPPDKVRLAKSHKQLLEEALIFRRRPEVGRVIFIAAPLRGSHLAGNWLGRVGSMLIKAPSHLFEMGTEALELIAFQPDELRLKRIPNSVDTLAPNNRFVKALQTIPLAPGVPYHVIAGDRGKGGNKSRVQPEMSDGVVPYWSSHLLGAASERVVPSSHSVHQHPEAIAEVERILKTSQ